ncbi:MAG: peptidyl-tRNA hydrolase Pth2 [Nanoarchaeota archaeon]
MKQAILVRADLKMDKGKLASQVAHASVEAVLRSSSSKVDLWRSEGMKKVILKVTDLNSLRDFQQKAKHEKLVAALITDSGRTKFHGTVTTTCLGIGPDTDELIDKVTHELKLL